MSLGYQQAHANPKVKPYQSPAIDFSGRDGRRYLFDGLAPIGLQALSH